MENKSCFIIMPFSKMRVGDIEYGEETLGYIYSDIIKATIADYHDNGKKVFTDISRYEAKIGSIITGIANNLNTSDLVIADLTGQNPNVMYELGVRHTLKRGTIIISQNVASLPADLRDYMCVEYKYSANTLEQKTNLQSFKEHLHIAIKELFSTDKFDSPVLSYLEGKSRYWKEDEIKKLKKDFIVKSYILNQYHEIKKLLADPDKYAAIKIAAMVDNIDSAIKDLHISLESPELYRNTLAARALIHDVMQKGMASLMFDGLVPNLLLAMNNAINNPIESSSLEFLNSSYTDYFILIKGEFIKVSFKQVFSDENSFHRLFLKQLEEHISKKATELGLSVADFS